MKRVFPAFFSVLTVLLTAAASCGCGRASGDIVGVWSCETYGGELVVEFTADGRFIDRESGDINRYEADGGTLRVRVEGAEEDAVVIPYRVEGDKLYFGEETVYVRLDASAPDRS